MKRFVLLCMCLIASNSFAHAGANFMKLCRAGDRDTWIVAERVIVESTREPTQDFCTEAYKVLRDMSVLDLGCDGYWSDKTCADDSRIKLLDWISEFQKINTLYLGGNQIKSIKPLQGLAQLESLYLEDNPIEDLDLLQSFVSRRNLRNLDLSKIAAVNDAFIQDQIIGWNSIEFLGLRHDVIRDISFVFDEFYTLSRLDISYTQVTNIKDLKGNSWEALGLDGLGLTWPQIQEAVDDVWFLSARHNHITEVSALNYSYGVIALALDDNQLKHLELKDFYGLRSISACNNDLHDLSGARSSDQLDLATLHGNPVTQAECESQLADSKNKAIVCGGLLKTCPSYMPAYRRMFAGMRKADKT